MYIKTTGMILKIEPDKTIALIQQEFNTAFPFLKIEFLKNGKTLQRMYPTQQLVNKEATLAAARLNSVQGEILVADTMTVKELEQDFFDSFGLTVQVFRKSGRLWLETTMTDNWTLKQQNQHGKEISAPPPID
ncbi:MAG: hypothetical protein RLZZ316_1700 [Bacteroidota bacterium]|jgi:hypothetical protein